MKPARALRKTPPADLSVSMLAWYDRHQRVLPWRARPGETSDPYRVWLSEIMLQQTTVAAVGPYFHKFLQRWPNVRALAAAPLDDVLGAWAGLGYYARARNLHKCAQYVAAHFDGRFPDTEEQLLTLPGVGPYTAAAIAAIAFDRAAVVVDGNVERVMARLFAISDPLPAGKQAMRDAAAFLSPALRPGDYAQAVMDLGATICTPRDPKCLACPWQAPCAARATAEPEKFPVRSAKAERPTRRGIAFVLVKPGAVWLRRRPEKGLLGGMLEAPSTPWRADSWSAAEARKFVPAKAEWTPSPASVRHVFTHFALELDVWTARNPRKEPNEGSWCRLGDLDQLAIPTLTRRVIDAALQPERQSRKPRARPRIMSK
jgi:A/G-specific adenine glycosylase